MSDEDYDDGDPYSCIAYGFEQWLRAFKVKVRNCYGRPDYEIKKLYREDPKRVLEILNALHLSCSESEPGLAAWALAKSTDLTSNLKE
jgi:hypothetical protein